MEYMDLWNKIVEYFEDNRNSEEKIIQHDWEKLFREFGYEKTEIDSQRSIQLGSTERGKPDIILRNGTEDLFVVELKRHTLHNGKEQLFSYLNQLKMNLGIVVCDKLYLYDYDFTQKNCFSEVEIPFEKDNPDGAKFVELFSKNNFDKQKICDFIKNKCNSQYNIAKIKNEISSELIKDLLKEHFKAKNSVSDEDFEEAYSEMNISVGTNAKMLEMPLKNAKAHVSHNTYQKDFTQYTVNGISTGGKCSTVYYAVKLYTEKYPNISFERLQSIFPDEAAKPGFGKMLRQKNDNSVSDWRRFKTQFIMLSDGTEFTVSTQWKPDNMESFVRFAKKAGIDIQAL